ncbi:hypothetical protein OPT61_g10750 [Boeremia exigua]|uniref:Uncharacterized protein n=1 Tax=Boeremia exigua TaxID=749465 RepID=A0ACC2HN03_9PLEO|nr:hypothetical protein OPT61_g10750 [Boeremia exigua]
MPGARRGASTINRTAATITATTTAESSTRDKEKQEKQDTAAARRRIVVPPAGAEQPVGLRCNFLRHGHCAPLTTAVLQHISSPAAPFQPFAMFGQRRARVWSISGQGRTVNSTFSAPHRSYAAVTAPPREEHFDVPCRSNGSIRLDVYHALDASAPILLYLPPGPVVPPDPDAEERVIAALRASSAATVVRINYRASSQHQFPTPNHDVLYGYDWIQENMLLDGAQKPYAARIGICGELMGGSIATMLALTECRVGESRIIAAAVNNPIVDWVFPDDLPHKKT